MKKLIAVLLMLITVLSLHAFTAEAVKEDFATVEALLFDREPEIDGKVSVKEWGQPTVAHIRYPENPQTDVRYDDQTDVEFSIWFRYAFDGFYIAAQTPDTSPCNHNVYDENIWNGDCLQIRLDPYGCTVDQRLIPSSDRGANFSKDYQEFAFAYCKDDGKCYAYGWHGVTTFQSLLNKGGKYSASNDGSITTYEVFIPWDELVYDMPHVGTSYGIAAALLTATEGENGNKWQNWLEWGTGVVNGRDDNICGTNRLVLVNKTVSSETPVTETDTETEVTTKAPVTETECDDVESDTGYIEDTQSETSNDTREAVTETEANATVSETGKAGTSDTEDTAAEKDDNNKNPAAKAEDTEAEKDRGENKLIKKLIIIIIIGVVIIAAAAIVIVILTRIKK